MASRLAVAALVIAVGTGAFFGGRASRGSRRPAAHGSFAAGYRAGHEDAFSGFDGGWSYGVPYIVTLRRGGPGITYRFARRWTMQPGVTYLACGRVVTRSACTSRPRRGHGTRRHRARRR